MTLTEVKQRFYKMLAAKEKHRVNPTFDNNLDRINTLNAYREGLKELTWPQARELQQENQQTVNA